MGFLNSAEASSAELKLRLKAREGLLSFGINYLDDSLTGIMPSDLVLIGAASGAGKTQICCNIALANIENGKRVHYFALEADTYEIERRLKYQIFAKYFFQDPNRPKISISFTKYCLGELWQTCQQYEIQSDDEFTKKYKNHWTFYKQDKFDVADMIFNVIGIAEKTDLIIIDHVHYFDYDEDRENKSIKEIAKMARTLALEQNKPIILVSHMRKRDKFVKEFCPSMEEFHGSSDLYKIATKAITVGPGPSNQFGGFDTYLRAVKNRYDGGVTRYIGKVSYDIKSGRYSKGYEIGKANQSGDGDFEVIDKTLQPDWCNNSTGEVSNNNHVAPRKPLFNHATGEPYVNGTSKKTNRRVDLD